MVYHVIKVLVGKSINMFKTYTRYIIGRENNRGKLYNTEWILFVERYCSIKIKGIEGIKNECECGG